MGLNFEPTHRCEHSCPQNANELFARAADRLEYQYGGGAQLLAAAYVAGMKKG